MMTATLAAPLLNYSEVAPGAWTVLLDGRAIGRVRKGGYRFDAYDASGAVLRAGCKTRAHAGPWYRAGPVPAGFILDALIATHSKAMLRASLMASVGDARADDAANVERTTLAELAAYVPATASEVRAKSNYLARRLEIGAAVEPAILLAFVYSLARYQAA